jgi:hypothetical protein
MNKPPAIDYRQHAGEVVAVCEGCGGEMVVQPVSQLDGRPLIVCSFCRHRAAIVDGVLVAEIVWTPPAAESD